ncbi:unnamed protein product [Dibothriocephalus latus]|uniref:Uncharacterized protein n=1 Tax=Dibothriocephalus latus TaxID=60516 RepID=A0A3P6U2B9_DIBLA|nr:unnamed protein product [Dibothriocephalus latus]
MRHSAIAATVSRGYVGPSKKVGGWGLVTEQNEVLDTIMHAHRLMCEVYSHPYNAAEVAEHLKATHSTPSSLEVAEEIREFIESDRFFTFTTLDLQLCPKITEILSDAFRSLNEELDYGLEERDFDALINPSSDINAVPKTCSSAELKRRYTLCDPVLVQHVYQAIVEATQHVNTIPNASDVNRLGASAALILTKVRARGVGRRYAGLSMAALKRILESLIQDSLIYQITGDSYRLV